jgi:hypothetical protein
LAETEDDKMGGMVPLGDASRRPARVPVVTAGIIVVNVVVFVLELMRGDAFVTQWAAVPAQIVSGHHWITILTAMFMHGSWSHIIGNMIFWLCAGIWITLRLTGVFEEGNFQYARQDERERMDEDSGMAGVPGLSQRDQRSRQDSATVGAT